VSGVAAVSQPDSAPRAVGNRVFRNWLIAAAATVILTLVCVAYLDRPLAQFFDLHLRHTPVWNGLYAALFPLGLVPVAAMLCLFACGTWLLSGRSLPDWARTPLLCSWATMWAIAVEIILKRIFGRGWPDPTYVQDHLYGFHLLQGAHEHWNSFPSGTALVSCAIAAVLWHAKPSWRIPVVVLVVVLCAAIVVTNLHWLGDMLPGIFLGVSIGWITVRLRASAHPLD
jgi:membrane-associated phospholipid phosphatase